MLPFDSNSNIGNIVSCLPGIGFGSFLYEVLIQKTPGTSGVLSNSYSSHICPVCGNGQTSLPPN